MIRIRRMYPRDISFAVGLSNREGWGTPRVDLERILRLAPQGSFLALEDSLKVGMITSFAFGKDLAWIGNVIVAKPFRGRHIGQLLVQQALAPLKANRVKCVGLYCYSNNVGFYRKLGFVRDLEFVRLRREFPERPTIHEHASLTLSRLVEIDRKSFGVDRSKLLRAVIKSGRGIYFGFSNRKSAAYLMVKKYSDMYDFGPGASINASKAELTELLKSAISGGSKLPIELSCFSKNRVMRQILGELRFRPINRGYRMFLKGGAIRGLDSGSFLLGFLDKG